MKQNAIRGLGVLILLSAGAIPFVGAAGQQSSTQPAPRPDAGAAAREAEGDEAQEGGIVAAGAVERPEEQQGGESETEEPQVIVTSKPATRAPIRTVQQSPEQPGRSKVLMPQGRAGTFEPLMQKELKYGEVPDEGEPISLDSARSAIPVTELLDTIAQATGWNVVSSPGLETKLVRFWVKEIRPKQALDVLKFNDIWYDYDKDTQFLYVMTKEEFLQRNYGELKRQEFQIEYADVTDMEALLSTLLSPKGRIVADVRSGSIIVWDTDENLAAMAEAEMRVDVPVEPRSYRIRYMDSEASDFLKSVESMLSERGVAHFDARSNTLVVTDLPSRQEQIGKMIEALDQKADTQTWRLNYADADVVAERLENAIPGGVVSITFDEDRHQVSVTGVAERLEEVDELIKQWDVKTRQVLIEAFLVSASAEIMRNFGIQWSYLGEYEGDPYLIQQGNAVPNYTTGPESGQRMTYGTVPYVTTVDEDGNTVTELISENHNLAAVLNYLDSKGDITVLSRPRVTVQDGGEATFEYTTELPYQEGGYSQYTYSDTDNPNFNRVIPLRVEFVEVGTILKVEPRISDDDNVLLAIQAEDSSAETVEVTVGDQTSTVPSKTQNYAETEVMVHDAQTLVIGGLRNSSYEDDVERTPILGDVPLLGRLFRNRSRNHTDRELFIFITSTIVDEYTHPEAERAADFEETASERFRHNSKSLWGRAKDRMVKGKNELGVSIGQSGEMHSNGEPVTLDALRETFAEAATEQIRPKVIIRSHPRAPEAIAVQVTESAEEIGLEVEIDDTRVPFVPAAPPVNAPGRAGVTSGKE